MTRRNWLYKVGLFIEYHRQDLAIAIISSSLYFTTIPLSIFKMEVDTRFERMGRLSAPAGFPNQCNKPDSANLPYTYCYLAADEGIEPLPISE